MAKKKVTNEELKEKEITPEEDQAKLNASLDVINFKKECSEKPFNEAVEEERKNIFVTYKKARTQSNIIMAVVVIIMVASLVVMVNFKNTWGPIAGGVAIGVTLVFLIVHYILTRNLFPNTTKKYIRFFMINSDNYVFDDENMHEQVLYFEKRYSNSDSLPDKVYQDVIDTASRNIVTAKYKEEPFECGELALYKAGAKRYQKAVIFVGKYLTLANSLHFEDRYVIRISGEKDTDAPNAIDDLVSLHKQNNFEVFGKEGADFERDLGKDLVNNLKSIDCTGALLNVNIVFWAGHTAVYLSYDDSIVAIPFDKELSVGSYQQLKKNIKDILEILVG